MLLNKLTLSQFSTLKGNTYNILSDTFTAGSYKTKIKAGYNSSITPAKSIIYCNFYISTYFLLNFCLKSLVQFRQLCTKFHYFFKARTIVKCIYSGERTFYLFLHTVQYEIWSSGGFTSALRLNRITLQPYADQQSLASPRITSRWNMEIQRDCSHWTRNFSLSTCNTKSIIFVMKISLQQQTRHNSSIN